MNIYETENLSFGDSCKNTRLFSTLSLSLPQWQKSFLPLNVCIHPLDIIRSTTKLLEIRSSKEENGADKEEGSGIQRSAKRDVRGLVKFALAVAYLLCLALLG